MEVSITQPLGFSQLGSRANNEDTLYPDPQTTDPQQRWFLVCDGVGGAEKGEVASQLAATEFDRYFRTHPVAVVTEAYVQQALTYVQDRFDDYVAANPQAESMGTTMTLVYRHDAGITVAHLGDSRVYLVRNGVIEWRTDDHSYVNELVKAGVLNPDEARKHPQRNVITRAIQGGQKRADADVQLLNDLQPGDYLFMCTDGILERISDELLEKTLGGPEPNDEKLSTLMACCYGHTRDNFTAYLIQVAGVTGSVASSARVRPPAYARPEAEDDDYSVTLIGVPRPEPLPAYANLNDALQPHDEAPTRQEPALPVAQNRVSLQDRPTMPPVSSVRPRQKKVRWMPWAVATLVLATGCLALWYWFVLLPGRATHQSRLTPPVKEVTSNFTPSPETASVVGSGVNPVSMTSDSVDKVRADSAVTVAASTTVTAKPESKSSAVAKSGLPAKTAEKESGLTVVSKKPNLKLEVVEDATGKQGLLVEGTVIFKPKFDKIELDKFAWGLIPVLLDSKKKVISKKGKLYDSSGLLSRKCERIPVKVDNRWGYVNLDGYERIKPEKYVEAGQFDETKGCTAQVTEAGGKSYRIDRFGDEIKPIVKPVKTTN